MAVHKHRINSPHGASDPSGAGMSFTMGGTAWGSFNPEGSAPDFAKNRVDSKLTGSTDNNGPHDVSMPAKTTSQVTSEIDRLANCPQAQLGYAVELQVDV